MSGARAAKEISESMIVNLNNDDEEYDRIIPFAIFRFMNPKRDLKCCLCHQSETSIVQGKMLAFKKGSRQIL